MRSAPEYIQRAINDFAALPREEQDAILRAQRESWARAEVRPYLTYPDDALIAEHRKWDDRIKDATSWGGALAAAAEARDECARELERRGIET